VRLERKRCSIDPILFVQRELNQITTTDGPAWKRARTPKFQADFLPGVHDVPMNANVGDRDTEIPVGISARGNIDCPCGASGSDRPAERANFLSYVTLRMEPRGANPHPKFIEHLKD
jgi:hypothetical protein